MITCRDEPVLGAWKLKILDTNANNSRVGTLSKWSLILWGEQGIIPPNSSNSSSTTISFSSIPTSTVVANATAGHQITNSSAPISGSNAIGTIDGVETSIIFLLIFLTLLVGSVWIALWLGLFVRRKVTLDEEDGMELRNLNEENLNEEDLENLSFRDDLEMGAAAGMLGGRG
jgi:hypothetical protein